MAQPQIRFQDGAGYERMMGVWSRIAGQVFLDLVPFATQQFSAGATVAGDMGIVHA